MRSITFITILLWLVAVAGSILCGCSGSGNPLGLTPDVQDASGLNKSADTGRVLWGLWELEYDTPKNTITAHATHLAEAHFNITPMLLPPQCSDCLKFQIISFNPTTRILDIDITLHNPYQISGYDVRGILYTNNYGHDLRNADGWTSYWDIPGGDDVNPFKAFAKDVSQRLFAGETQYKEKYLVYIPNPPHYNAITFAVDASFPTNCKEPYQITNFWQEAITDIQGSLCNIYLDVYDWQDDVSEVTLEAPEITGQPSSPMSILVGDVWTLELQNNTGADAGDYVARVSAKSANSGTSALYYYINLEITPAPPVVTGINPTEGLAGDIITGAIVSGHDFKGPGALAKLKKDGEPEIVGTNVVVTDSSSISCDFSIPLETTPGLYGVEVTNENGLSGLAADIFEIYSEPGASVNSISPDNSLQDVQLIGVTILGSGFEGANPTVTLKQNGAPDIVADNVIIIDGTEINCDIYIPPESFTGTYDVEVTSDSGFFAVGIGLFEVITPSFNLVDVTPPYLSIDNIDSLDTWGEYTYAFDSLQGLAILDCTQPEEAFTKGLIPVDMFGQGAVWDGYAYVGDGYDLQVMDVSPPETGSILQTVSNASADWIAADNGFVYEVDMNGWFTIVDAQTPGAAYVAKGFSLPLFSYDFKVAASNGYAYVVANFVAPDRTFSTIDVDPPGDASLLATITMPSPPVDVTSQGNYAYVAGSAAGLHIIDVSNPAAPTIIKTVDTPVAAKAVAVSGGYAYIADYDGGLQVIDVSPPESAYLVTGLDNIGQAIDVSVSNGYAYLLVDYGVLKIIKLW